MPITTTFQTRNGLARVTARDAAEGAAVVAAHAAYEAELERLSKLGLGRAEFQAKADDAWDRTVGVYLSGERKTTTNARTRKLVSRSDGLFQLEIKGLGRRSPALTRTGMLRSIDRLFALGEITERNALTLKAALVPELRA